MSLRGKCALITGSTGGLGRTVAEHFASERCNVILHGVVPEADMAATVANLEKIYGIKARYDRADLRKPDEIAAMMQRAFEAFGAVDILVNNAVVRHFSPIDKFPVERWDEALAVNVSAVFHTIRLALPMMRERGWGRIINVASPYSFIAVANRIDYVTTKTALLGLTRAVAMETADEDITCNAVAPATLPTPAIEGKIRGIAGEQGISVDAATKNYLAERQPGGRFVSMQAVAALMGFLCGPNSRDISGAAIPMDCGWTVS
jgi:3-hydroxybutyrate dehydrogenase